MVSRKNTRSLVSGETNRPSSTSDPLCVGCGHNLRGIASDECCPECGVPVTRSMGGDLLSAADPRWLERLCRGQLYLAIIPVALIALWVTMLPLEAAFDDFLRENRHFIIVTRAIQGLLWFACLLLGVVGVTTRDPRLTFTERPIGLRRLARGAAVAVLVIMPLYFLLEYGSYAAAAIAPFVHGVLTNAFKAMVFLTVVAVTFYLSRLARRVPNDRLARRARSIPEYFVLFLAISIVATRSARLAGYDSATMLTSDSPLWVTVGTIGTLFGLAAILCLIAITLLWVQFYTVFKHCLLEARKNEEKAA